MISFLFALKKSRCTFSFYFKNYYCSHIISLAVKQKFIAMPLEFIQKAPKVKAGRPAKAKECQANQKSN